MSDLEKDSPHNDHPEKEEDSVLAVIESKLELPMIILGIIWLVLLILELTTGLSSTLQVVSLVIWVVFILDFLLKVLVAQRKVRFLQKNLLTIISLIIPALRVFRIFRFVQLLRSIRATQSIRLVSIFGSANRGMRVLSKVMSRRGFGYVLLVTVLVILLGAAGMFAFERSANSGFTDFGTALWWSAMLVASIGTDRWPLTPEGRVLSFVLSVYGFATFGYVTATIASFFIDMDTHDDDGKLAGADQISELKEQVLLLREELKHLRKDDGKKE